MKARKKQLRKRRPVVTLNLRLPAKLHTKMKAAARKNDSSLNGFIIGRLKLVEELLRFLDFDGGNEDAHVAGGNGFDEPQSQASSHSA